MAMNIGGVKPDAGVADRRCRAPRKTAAWLLSTYMMSSKRVIDQYGPNWLALHEVHRILAAQALEARQVPPVPEEFHAAGVELVEGNGVRIRD